MKFIGNRISYQNKEGIFSIVIAATVEKSYERLLLAWLILWSLCGGYFIFQLFGDHPRELKMYMAILLSFWAYYEVKVGRVYFWRKSGYESIKFIGDKLTISEVTLGRSIPKSYFLENIKTFVADMPKATNFLDFISNSFWVKGAPYIKFEYQGESINFGRQVGEVERKALVNAMNKELALRKKKL